MGGSLPEARRRVFDCRLLRRPQGLIDSPRASVSRYVRPSAAEESDVERAAVLAAAASRSLSDGREGLELFSAYERAHRRGARRLRFPPAGIARVARFIGRHGGVMVPGGRRRFIAGSRGR